MGDKYRDVIKFPTISFERRLKNGIHEHERTSDRNISPNKYYVVNISSYITLKKYKQLHSPEETTNFPKYILESIDASTKQDSTSEKPVIVYTYSIKENRQRYVNIILLFDKSTQVHFQNGSSQLIVSWYVSYYSRLFESNVIAKVIEMDTKVQVLSYFYLSMNINMTSSLIGVSKGKIKEHDIEACTIDECLDRLSSKQRVSWEKMENSNKFGINYKFSGEKLISLAEMIDFRNIDKYISYFFE